MKRMVSGSYFPDGLIYVFSFLVVLISATCAALPSPAFADEYHYNNLLIGDRASGMGGAYTAISDDATGLYYNPGGVAYATGRNLSASVNAYYNLTKTYDGVIGGHGWERKSSALLPNYFGIVQPMGRFKFGFSYVVPDSNKEDQDQTFTNLQLSPSAAANNPGVTVSSYTINFNNDDNTYQFGPTIAGELAQDFAAGITLYVHQRHVQRTLNQFLAFSNGGYEWTSFYYELNETGLKPTLGLVWSPVNKVSLGLSVSKVMLLKSSRNIQLTYGLDNLNIDSNGDGSVDLNSIPPAPQFDSIQTKKTYPFQTTLGAAYFPTSNLVLSADLAYYTKVAGDNSLGDPTFSEREAVLNWAFGAEYYLSRTWAVRGGLFNSNANTPEIKNGTPSIAEEHIDLYGGSLSISNFTRNTSVSFGGSLAWGAGKAQIISGSTSANNVESLGWMLFLSSSYSY